MTMSTHSTERLPVRPLAEGPPPLDHGNIIRETRAMVSAELDDEREATLTTRLATYFGDHAHTHVLALISKLSTPRMLAAAFMTGENIRAAA